MTPQATSNVLERPRLRGRLHQIGFFVAVVAAPLIVVAAPPDQRLPTGVFAVTLVALLGTSAAYHRVAWSPGARAWMRRLDHSMIFLLIAGTYTAAGTLALPDGRAGVVLAVVWAGAAAGIVVQLFWVRAPKPVVAAAYLALGWVALAVLPDLYRLLDPVAFALLVAGGVAYTVGALAYATRRPNPVPAVFGYHEVFHAFVLVGAASHYAMIALGNAAV